MLIDTAQSKLLIVSDLHIGNPYSNAGRSLCGFLRYARKFGFNVCINGDGLEILQARFCHLANDSVGVLKEFRQHIEQGLGLFYVVGNHDIALENFLVNWPSIQISPFLNITSKTTRIRVEHGHLYDPAYLKSPVGYERLTRLAGPVLNLYPDIYKLWSACEVRAHRLQKKLRRNAGKLDPYQEAAQMLLQRGFDVVVFGHTHAAEEHRLEEDGRYINCGNWVRGGTYVEVNAGHVKLKEWDAMREQPAANGDLRLKGSSR